MAPDGVAGGSYGSRRDRVVVRRADQAGMGGEWLRWLFSPDRRTELARGEDMIVG